MQSLTDPTLKSTLLPITTLKVCYFTLIKLQSKTADAVSQQILNLLSICKLSTVNISVVVTDGAEISSASKIGSNNTLWVWCTVHLLSLAFQGSFMCFPQHPVEKQAICLVMLRKTVNLLIENFDKLSPFLPIPEGCHKVQYKTRFICVEKKI